MNIYLKTAIIILLSPLALKAQQIPVHNLYVLNPMLYNPAFCGSDSLGNIYINQRNQWTAMTDAPLSTVLTIDAPLFKNKVGLGGNFFYDQKHIIRTLGASLDYSYHLYFSNKVEHKLSFGISSGVIHQSLRLDDQSLVYSTGDFVIDSTERNATTFDVAFGLNYRYKGLNIGFSVPQLAASKITYKDRADGSANPGSEFSLVRHFFVRGSYRFDFGTNKNYSLEPGAMVRYVKNLPVQVDINALMRYKKKAWFGLGYRLGNDAYSTAGINALAGVNAFEIFNISVAYENLLNNDYRPAFGHTLEFLLGVKFGGAAKKIKELERRLLEADERMVIKIDSVTVTRTRMEADERQTIRETIKEVVRNESELDERMRIHDDTRNDIMKELEAANKRVEALENRINNENNANSGNNSQGNNTNGKPEFNKKGISSLDTLESVYFAKGSNTLTEFSKSKLNRAATVLASNYDLKNTEIVLYGNASEEGENDSNLILSLQRAKIVKEYLLSLGIKADYIITVPNGEDKPVNAQKTEEERLLNRRVDILVKM